MPLEINGKGDVVGKLRRVRVHPRRVWVHAAPTTGKSTLAQDQAVLDTDTLIFGLFAGRHGGADMWRKVWADRPPDPALAAAYSELMMSSVGYTFLEATAPRNNLLVLSNLKLSSEWAPITFSFFRRPAVLEAISLKRDEVPMKLEVVEGWYKGWLRHSRFHRRFLLEEGEYLSDALQIEPRPAADPDRFSPILQKWVAASPGFKSHGCDSADQEAS